jgi:N-acetylneuraminic acid mutarotase
MRKSAALLLILVFLTASSIMVAKPAFSSVDAAQDTWAVKAPMRQARAGLGVAVVNGKIYAIGGFVENGVVTGTNEEYNPATNTWTYKKPMPTSRSYFATAVYQNKIYCISEGVNEVYNTATDTWETKTPMPTARTGLQANVVNGKIYLIGGYVSAYYTTYNFSSSFLTLNEVYDPANDSWTTKALMPTAASNYASAVVDNKIYIIGGLLKSEEYTLNQIYDPATDTWSIGAPSPSITAYGAVGATTGVNAPKRIYLLGQDFTFPEPPYINRVYDPTADTWTIGVPVPTERRGFGVAVVNDLLYVIGGFTETFDMFWNSDVTLYATNEQYTPFGYGTPDPSYDGTAPEITIASPENKTYYTADAGLNSTDIALDFTVDEPVFSVHFVLDGGTPVEISGNTTLSELAIGAHNVTVFGFDASGNMGTSETVFFAIAEPEPFPTTFVAVASGVSMAVISIGLLVYFKKRKR